MRKAGNKWQLAITLDQATLDRLEWMTENCGLDTVSAAIRYSVAEQYRRTNTDAKKQG